MASNIKQLQKIRRRKLVFLHHISYQRYHEKCMKAHSMIIAKEFGLSKLYTKLEKLPIEKGHNGFYLDKNKVKNVNLKN